MKELMKRAEKIVDAALTLRMSGLVLLISFAGIMAIRTFIKTFLAHSSYTGIGAFIDYIHEFFFFGIIFILIWLLLGFILKVNVSKLSGLIGWAALIIIFPPLLDILKTGGSIYWSFYLLGGVREIWSEYISIFGNLPTGIVYFGTKIVFLIVVFLIFGLVYVKTKQLFKAFFAAVAAYSVFFLLGAFPSIFAFGYYTLSRSIPLGEVGTMDVFALFSGITRIFGLEFSDLRYSLAYGINVIFYALFVLLVSVVFFAADRKKFILMAKNARLPQIIYHGGLFLVGLGLGFLAYPDNFEVNVFSVFAVLDLLIAIIFAWLASVVVNDLSDFDVDTVSNPARPLPQKVFSRTEYGELGAILFVLSLLGALTVDLKFAGMLLIYQIVAWIYSAGPYRLKRFPILATLLSASASFVVLAIGFTLFSGSLNIQELSWRVVALILAALTLSLPIKDFKDIEGDRKYGVQTIPVIFGEAKGRLIVAVGIFISFMLSVFLLNELRLFWPALLLGSMAFLYTLKKKPHQLFWWVGSVVFFYLLIMVKVLFLN